MRTHLLSLVSKRRHPESIQLVDLLYYVRLQIKKLQAVNMREKYQASPDLCVLSVSIAKTSSMLKKKKNKKKNIWFLFLHWHFKVNAAFYNGVPSHSEGFSVNICMCSVL